jgi:hypothetical protein
VRLWQLFRGYRVSDAPCTKLDAFTPRFDSSFMKFQCTISQQTGGRWTARHAGTGDIGAVEVTGASRAEALEKMENELRYRVEMCPCTGRAFRNLEIEIVER